MAVELCPVNARNWRVLIKLQVREDQKDFVASNLLSIAEAQFGFDDDGGHWDLYPVGVYVNEEPVGFMMYCLNLAYQRFEGFVARLMIDEHYQGKGYGREAMQQILDQLRTNPQVHAVGISYEPSNEVARNLYASLGFVEPGEMLGEETLAVLKLE